MTNHPQARYRPAFPRLIAQRFVARVRSDRVQPLTRLADVHPGAPAGGRWIGLRTVPIDSIRGTASTSAAASRARDFRPLDERAPADWQYRWSRLMSATWEQAILPPIQVLKTGDHYWVVDGHNRVALARERGQLWIDADVTELDLDSGNAASSAKEN
jgi:hypothetical protein